MKKIFTLAAALCFTAMANAQVIAQLGFEEGDSKYTTEEALTPGGTYGDWVNRKTYDEWVEPFNGDKHSGEYSFRANNFNEDGVEYYSWDRGFKMGNLQGIKPETSYRVSFWAKADPTFIAADGTDQATTITSHLSTGMENFDCSFTSTKGNDYSFDFKSFNGDWKHYSYVTYFTSMETQNQVLPNGAYERSWIGNSQYPGGAEGETYLMHFNNQFPENMFFVVFNMWSAGEYLLDDITIEEGTFNAVTFSDDVIKFDFGYPTNIANLAKAAPDGVFHIDPSLIKVTRGDEILDVYCLEGHSDGFVYAFLTDEMLDPDEEVYVSLATPAEITYNTDKRPAVYADGDAEMPAVQVEDELAYYDETIDAIPSSWTAPEFLSANPENESFELDAGTFKTVELRFNKVVDITYASAVLSWSDNFGQYERDLTATMAVNDDMESITITIDKALADGEYKLTVSDIASEQGVTMANPIVLQYQIGPDYSEGTSEDVFCPDFSTVANGTFPAGWISDDNGTIHQYILNDDGSVGNYDWGGNIGGGGARMFGGFTGGDFTKALYWRSLNGAGYATLTYGEQVNDFELSDGTYDPEMPENIQLYLEPGKYQISFLMAAWKFEGEVEGVYPKFDFLLQDVKGNETFAKFTDVEAKPCTKGGYTLDGTSVETVKAFTINASGYYILKFECQGYKELLMAKCKVQKIIGETIELQNTFVLPDLTVSQGSQATLQIGLDNSDEITGFQFDLVLPEGVSVQKDGGDHVVNLSSGRASYRNHNVSSNMQGDGSLRVVCSSNSNKVFAGSTGTLVEIPLEISQSIATGSYGVKLKNIELATPALVKYNPTDVVSTMTVESGTSALNVEVQEEVDVPAFAYDYALGYEGGQGRYDTSMVEDAIGCSAADATVYGYNPSTGEFVKNGMDVSDGWHAANGDLQSWGEAAFNIQFYNDGTFWYCTMPDVAKPGVTYKASWLLVNPETGDAVQYNFVMKDSKAQDGEELDGIYYLQNVESGEWLGGGNSWGTQASLIKHPNPFCIKIENGKYTIDTFTYDNADCHYLGNMGGLYLDCAVAYWDIDKVDDDIFTLSLDGNYIGYDGTSVVAEFATSNSSATQWRLISKDDMLKNFDEATQSNPVDATFLIQVPNFSRNQAYTARNQSPWTVEAANIQLSGGNNTNNCAESWRSSNGFDVYQTLTDIPNGLYKLDVQGSVCDHAGTFENLAYAYANEQTSAFISSSKWADGTMEDGENSMPAMSESFTAGKYQLEPIFVTVTDGTLRVGVRSSRTDTWAVWDNFELTYLGEISSFAGDLLTADMYHSWSTSGADAEDKGTTDCNYKINDQSASDSVPYGDGNVYYLNYADLTAYSTMEIEFTEGTPRLLFNRDGDYGPVNPEINGSAGMDYVTVGEGIWTIDLAAITEDFGYAHLNCIKGANWTNATITRVELFKAEASAPIVAPVKVESIVGNSYEGIAAGIEGDIAMEVAEYLGVTKAEEVAMATYDEKGNLVTENGGRGETDGWRNAEGAFVNWGTEGFTYYVEPYAELDNGAWSFGAYVGSAPGAVTAPIDFTQKVRFSANGKSVEFPITLSYVNRPELKIEVQEEVDVPAIIYDFTLGYAGGEGTYDTSMVEDAIGCSIAEAEVFGFDIVTEEPVRGAMATFDGWFNPEGTPSNWGTPAAFDVKFYNDGTFWYCVRDDVAELGATYKCAWLLVNPETGDAVQYNFTMNDIERAAYVLEDGEYYFYNAEAGAWLGGGNSWGSQASLLKHGYPFHVTKVADNVYTIDSYTYNNDAQHFLGANLYIDADVTNWTAEKVGKGANDWAFSVDGNYMGYDGSSNILANLTDKDAAGACWTLVTRAELEAALADADPDSPADATFLIQVPNFSRNQAYTARNQSPWTVEAANCNRSGGNNTNNCAESWRSSNGFNVYQTLTNLPNGNYRLDLQGSVCDYAGTFENLAYAYANEQTSAFISSSKWADGTMEDGENSMSAMSESFTAGKYQLEPIFVTVTDGTLTIGVQSPRTDTWAVWDNFELTYLGLNVSVKKTVEVPAFEYDYALGYDGGEGTYDIATVEETIGCAAADATVYGYNPSTGEFVKNGMDVSDGWHAANGDFAGWGEAPFCLKFYNDGTFWYCAMPDVAELGATYKASWLLVNPRTGDAVQYNFTMNDVTRGPIFAEGEYYLYNEEADAWLGGGNSWGTHATLIKHGMPVYIGECQNGNVYTINTYTYNNANDHYLGWDAGGSGFFVDAYSQGLTFTKVSGAENKYFISANGSYIGTAADAAAFAGSPVDLLPTTDVAQAAQWTLVTRAEREAILAAATPDSPADATFLIQVPNFSRNQAYTGQGQSPWTKEAANCNISGGDNTNNNAESWRSSNGFNVYQTLTNLPTGVYRIDVQGAVCEYANPKNGKDLAVAYANDATTPFVVSELADRQAGNENSMSEMSASFTAGKYQLEPMYVTVTDGTLTVGVKSPRTDTWAVWDNFELTYYGEDYIPAGEYYLYNAEAGAWLAGGNSWGTQASLNKHGMPVYISYEGNNAYSIDTYTYNSDVQHFLGSNLYVDADKTNWTVERVGEGVNDWAFSVNGNYVGYDGSSDILVNLTDKNAAGACWTLVTRAERQATLAEATIDNPVDATFYIEVPNFSRNQAFTARNQSPWTAVGANVEDAAGNKNLSGGNNINNNAESWRSSNGFNVYQTLTNLPSGVYELRAQAAVCDYAGTFVDLAYVYANDKKSAFNSSSRWAEGVQENGENSMSAMSESFTAGKYAVKPIHILVTDGQIELGVYSPRTDTWAVWDNFELYYLGQDAEVNHEDPKYTMVATDNVVIEYHATAPQASQAIDATNYLATLGAASAEETQLYAVDTNAGLTLDPLSWVNFTGYFNAEGCVSGLVDAAVKANVDLAGKQVTVEALAETVEPRYHAYAVLACEKTAKAILIAIEVNFVDRPDYAEFTAINNVKADGADAKIFDLSGREVKKATKGVYIINGVKTFVK